MSEEVQNRLLSIGNIESDLLFEIQNKALTKQVQYNLCQHLTQKVRSSFILSMG